MRTENVQTSEGVAAEADLGPKAKSATATLGGISKVVLFIYAVVALIAIAAIILYFSGKF